ncbi:MAG: hypothetical protein H7833_20095 [Magnetococcus sp. DMHC-1]|nr:transcriptional regulator [Magnetococcales bacterium]
MTTHDEMVAEWMADPEFKAAYDALDDDFRLFDELLAVRKNAELTQAKVAEKLRNECSDAVGCRMDVKLVPG